MTDTPPEVANRLQSLYAAQSGSARVRMMCEMFSLARALIVADLRRREPEISEQELRIRIFERTYGEDLTDAQRCRIIERLGGSDRAGR